MEPTDTTGFRTRAQTPAAGRGGTFRWDKAAVTEGLRRRHAQGLDLNHTAVQKSDSGLAKAACRHYGSYDEALRAAGIDPASVRKVIAWDRPRIVEALRQRHARGEAVHSSAIQRSDSRLGEAIRNHFDSHHAALRAAGIDPPVVERPRIWSRDRIVEALQARAAAGLKMTVFAIREADKPLGGAMIRYFGSCDAALRAAGIDPAAEAAKQWSWDQATVVARLRDRVAEGLAVNKRAVSTSDRGLCWAIRRHFGSHDAALRAAGIDPQSVRKKRPHWSEAEILSTLRGLSRDGVLPWPLSKHGGTGLAAAVKHRFESVEAAAAAAGLRYERPPAGKDIGHWTDQLVLQTLRDLHAQGHDLRYRPMQHRSQPLFFAARHFFGSYVNAVRQAGIDYTDVVRAQLARERAERGERARTRPDEDPAQLGQRTPPLR